MVETHTRILGIAPYDGMRTAMEQAAQAYPNVELEVYTGDLEEGQAIVQRMAPNSYDCIISRGGTATLIRQVTDLPVVDIHISVYDVPSPIPATSLISSMEVKVPFSSRRAIIASALDSPIPGKVTRSSFDALLMFTVSFLWEADKSFCEDCSSLSASFASSFDGT